MLKAYTGLVMIGVHAVDNDFETWLESLSNGDERAAEVLWEEHFESIMRAARRYLGRMPRRASDEEDVAVSALNSFVGGVRAGRFNDLKDACELWRLLLTITARKATANRRRYVSRKRGRGKVRGESVFMKSRDLSPSPGMDQVAGASSDPAVAVEMSENCQMLLEELSEPILRKIAVMKLEGFQNVEIATELDCGVRTVERKLNRIRDQWERIGTDANPS